MNSQLGGGDGEKKKGQDRVQEVFRLNSRPVASLQSASLPGSGWVVSGGCASGRRPTRRDNGGAKAWGGSALHCFAIRAAVGTLGETPVGVCCPWPLSANAATVP